MRQNSTFNSPEEDATMIGYARAAAFTVGMIALGTVASLSAAAVEQVQQGRWYSFHTAPAGTCPGLDWHVVVEDDRSITGFVAWDRMRHSANIAGKLNADDSFQYKATEVGGSRVASVSGQVSPEFVTVAIDGTGTGCDKKSWKIRRAIDSGAVGSGG